MSKDEAIDRGDFIEDLDDDKDIELDDIDDEEEDLVEDEEDIEDEEVDEDEEDLEDDEEEEDDEEDGDDEEDHRIPKSRLDEVIAQRNEERDRVAWLEDQLATIIANNNSGNKELAEEVIEQAPEYDFDGNEAKYIELILEGEVQDAAKLRREIESAREAQTEYRMNILREEAAQHSTNAYEERKYQEILGQTVKTYKIFDDQSDGYNEDATMMANTLMAGFMSQGYSKNEALAMAVKKVTPMYVQDDKPKKGAIRKNTAAKRAVKAAKAQPPKTRSSKASKRDLDNLDINKLSEKQFNSLTKKEKAILRGDF